METVYNLYENSLTSYYLLLYKWLKHKHLHDKHLCYKRLGKLFIQTESKSVFLSTCTDQDHFSYRLFQCPGC